MKIVIADGVGKSGKQIVIDAIVEDIETGKPLSDCPPGYYSSRITGVTVKHDHRGANKTPVEQQIIMADFAALEERVLDAMKNEVYRQSLEKLVWPYQRRIIAATATVYRDKKKEPQSTKSKTKGPRNRWGAVK